MTASCASFQPGQSVTYRAEIVRRHFEDAGAEGTVGFRVMSPGRCRLVFEYASPRITGEQWKARSKPLIIDFFLAPSPPPAPPPREWPPL